MKLPKHSSYDIICGVPSYNEGARIAKVVKVLDKGLQKYFPRKRTLILNGDGGSTDDTREKFLSVETKSEKLWFQTPKGVTGKGAVFDRFFRIGVMLKPKVMIVTDADLESVTPSWVYRFATPILNGKDFLVPYYIRHKYDGTITNFICYPFIHSVFNADIRQPIGGDFAFSGKYLRYIQKQSLPKNAKKFGIDIFMTSHALLGNFAVGQIALGQKVHKPSLPKLPGMFVDVTDTLFSILLSNKARLHKLTELTTYSVIGKASAKRSFMAETQSRFFTRQFLGEFPKRRAMLKQCLDDTLFSLVDDMYTSRKCRIDSNLWYGIVYCVLRCYARNPDVELVEALRPLYFARVASFIHETNNDTNRQAELKIRSQARLFRERRAHLLHLLT